MANLVKVGQSSTFLNPNQVKYLNDIVYGE